MTDDGGELRCTDDGRVRALGPAARLDLACRALAAAGPAATRRGEVRFLTAPDGTRLACRRYRHGGLLGRLLGERYLGLGRAARELQLYRTARALGVPTLDPWAVRAERAGFFWWLDLVTRAEEGAQDLGALYDRGFARAPFALRAAVMELAGQAVGALFAAGVVHPDLNVTNLLVCGLAEGPWRLADGAALRVLVIDLDRARAVPGGRPLSAGAAGRTLARLWRSVWKRAFFGRAAPSVRDQLRFLGACARARAVSGAGTTPGRLRVWVDRVRRAGRGLWVHRLRWHLDRAFGYRHAE